MDGSVFQYAPTYCSIAWLSFLAVLSFAEFPTWHKETSFAQGPVLVRRMGRRSTPKEEKERAACNHQEILDALRQEKTVCNHQEIVDLLRKDATVMQYEEVIDELQKELCAMSMQPECNHDEIIASLQKELYETFVHVSTHQEIVSALEQELYQARSVPPTCNHHDVISALQLELYYTKIELEKIRKESTHTARTPGSRLETIVLRQVDTTGIPDAKIFDVVRTNAPRLRKDDLYHCLRVLQERGWIKETPEKVWVRVRARDRTPRS